MLGCLSVAHAQTKEVQVPVKGEVISGAVFSSTVTGIDYPLRIYLPHDYADTTLSFPAIYVTDAQWNFSHYVKFLDDNRKSIVLVGIEQGPNNRRAIDFKFPGSISYYRFLVDELLPRVESTLRIDASQRTLMGTSLGGLFVSTAMLLGDGSNPPFVNYVASDPSLGYSKTQMKELEKRRWSKTRKLNVNFVISGSMISPNRKAFPRFKRMLTSRPYEGLKIIQKTFSVHHNDMPKPTFEAAIEALF